MKKLHNTKKKAIIRFPLYERSIAAIKSFDANVAFYDDSDDNDILEHFELLYELEYKYNMLKSRPFSGVEKRYDNILKVIENMSHEVISPLAGALESVFDVWLDNHAITDPQKWAEQRFYDNGDDFYDNGDDIVNIYGFGDALGIVLSELKRYSSSYTEHDLIIDTIERNSNVTNEKFLDLIILDEYNMMVSDLEDIEIEEFNNMYSELLGKKFTTEDEVRDFLDNNFSAFDQDFFNVFGGKKEATRYLIDFLIDTEFFLNVNASQIEELLNLDEFFITAYRDIVFPEWYNYWSSRGIDQTRANVEKVHKDLLKIESKPLQKKFLTMNIALNTSHQNGSMMEYFSGRFGVGSHDLDKLSNMDTKNWDKELQELGVQI